MSKEKMTIKKIVELLMKFKDEVEKSDNLELSGLDDFYRVDEFLDLLNRRYNKDE